MELNGKEDDHRAQAPESVGKRGEMALWGGGDAEVQACAWSLSLTPLSLCTPTLGSFSLMIPPDVMGHLYALTSPQLTAVASVVMQILGTSESPGLVVEVNAVGRLHMFEWQWCWAARPWRS